MHIGKNTSLTSTRNKAKIDYISGGQPSPFELAFGVELGLNLYSKMVLESILDLGIEMSRAACQGPLARPI